MRCPFCNSKDMFTEAVVTITLTDAEDPKDKEVGYELEDSKLHAMRCRNCGGQFLY